MGIINIFTKKSLLKNRSRTTVTILGVILSTALICAITTSIASLRHFMIQEILHDSGDWYGAIQDASSEKIEELQSDQTIKTISSIGSIGFASETFDNEFKHYIFVAAANKEYFTHMPIHLTAGRYPEKQGEILLPDSYPYSLDKSITLDLGTRSTKHGGDGYLSNNIQWIEDEILKDIHRHEYQVVGFYDSKHSIESYNSPGITALSFDEAQTKLEHYNLFIKTKKPKQIYARTDITYTNSKLLLLLGASKYDAFYKVLYTFAAILIFLVVVGSISLIYNAFSISISERTRQFGILTSVGATKWQLRKAVLYEAFLLSILGIPLGILLGIGGIGITLHFVSEILTSIFRSNIQLNVTISFMAISIGVIISVITMIISAWLPSKRATKISAISAMKQSNDIKINPKNLKKYRHSNITYRLFGLPGILAKKHFKRNRRKYRATIISLFMSIVLFVSSSSFTNYLRQSVNDSMKNFNFDISVSAKIYEQSEEYAIEKLYPILKSTQGVEYVNYYVISDMILNIPTASFSKKAIQAFSLNDQESLVRSFSITYLQDEAFRETLHNNGLSEKEYMDPEHPKALIVDIGKQMNPITQRIETINLFAKEKAPAVAYRFKDVIEGETFSHYDTKTETAVYYGNEKETSWPLSEALESTHTIQLGATIKEAPMGTIPANVTLILPYQFRYQLSSKFITTQFAIKSNNPSLTEEKLNEIAIEDLSTHWTNFAENLKAVRGIITIINIFSYSFIVLITLIAIANVFNTITTNIQLRRKEFAMLKSVGMSSNGFKKMMNYECILYGSKSLIYGLPVSLLFTYVMHRGISAGIEMEFIFPWKSMLIAVISVFIVVFSTMLFAMSKVKKENPIDALKNENW